MLIRVKNDAFRGIEKRASVVLRNLGLLDLAENGNAFVKGRAI